MYLIVAMRIQLTSTINCILVNFNFPPFKPRLNRDLMQIRVKSRYSLTVHIYTFIFVKTDASLL